MNEAQAAWHDETLWMVREKRDRLSREIPEWEDLRNAASAIKSYSNSHLDTLLQQFEEQATKNGAIVHWIKDAEEYRQTILSILEEHHVHRFIKSKSMLAEECRLNPFLLEHGINVVESDLGERILQLLHKRPSHIVMPAIHIKKEEIGELFVKEMNTTPGNNDQTYLTHAARRGLRHNFLEAEAAMTGANFAVAETGECVVCTNEGNADLGMSMPKLQITAFGIDKIVPTRRSLGVFTRLLARSATGQVSTAFTAHNSHPHPGGEYHILIVDNGRSQLIANKAHRKVMNCLRCGACMNTCPVYRRSGGYSYSYFIPGPIGINLGMLADPHRHSGNVSACSLCYSCQNVCPAKVDLSDQIYLWRQELKRHNEESKAKHAMSRGMQFLMERPRLFQTALRFAPLANHLPRFMVYNKLNPWGLYHELPRFVKPEKSHSEK